MSDQTPHADRDHSEPRTYQDGILERVGRAIEEADAIKGFTAIVPLKVANAARVYAERHAAWLAARERTLALDAELTAAKARETAIRERCNEASTAMEAAVLEAGLA